MKGLHFKNRVSRGAEKSKENIQMSSIDFETYENDTGMSFDDLCVATAKLYIEANKNTTLTIEESASKLHQFSEWLVVRMYKRYKNYQPTTDVSTDNTEEQSADKSAAVEGTKASPNIAEIKETVLNTTVDTKRVKPARETKSTDVHQQKAPQQSVVTPDSVGFVAPPEQPEKTSGFHIGNCYFSSFFESEEEAMKQELKTAPIFQTTAQSKLFGDFVNDGDSKAPRVSNTIVDYGVNPPPNMQPSMKLPQYQIAGMYDRFKNNPVHKVDEPQKPQKPSVIKPSDPEGVHVDLGGLSDIPVIDTKKKEIPDIINADKIVAEPESMIKTTEEKPPFVPLYTDWNNEIAQKFKNAQATLHKIESIATSLRAQCKFDLYPSTPYNKVILVYITPDGQTDYDPYRSFIIDPGVIIDRRVKLFPAFYDPTISKWPILESYHPYDLKSNRIKDGGEFDENLVKGIITYGHNNVNPRTSLMSDELIKLNKYVELSSMPTKFMNADIRNMIRARLFKFMEDGNFDRVYSTAIWSRWRFATGSCDGSTYSFALTNRMTPWCFGGTVVPNPVIEIYFHANGQVEVAKVNNDNTLVEPKFVTKTNSTQKIEVISKEIIRDPKVEPTAPLPNPSDYERNLRGNKPKTGEVPKKPQRQGQEELVMPKVNPELTTESDNGEKPAVELKVKG